MTEGDDAMQSDREEESPDGDPSHPEASESGNQDDDGGCPQDPKAQ